MRNSKQSRKPVAMLIVISTLALIVAFSLKPKIQSGSAARLALTQKRAVGKPHPAAALVVIDIQKDF